MDKIDFLEKNYDYQRAWITHANSAAAIGLTISCLFVSWTLVNKTEVLLEHTRVFIFSALFFGLSIYNYIKVIFPNLAESESLIYFNAIALMGKEKFSKKISYLDQGTLENEYISQIYILACIARKKFQNFRVALLFSGLTLFMCLMIVYLGF